MRKVLKTMYPSLLPPLTLCQSFEQERRDLPACGVVQLLKKVERGVKKKTMGRTRIRSSSSSSNQKKKNNNNNQSNWPR